MKFYSLLAEHYEALFPLNRQEVRFILENHPGPGLGILDAGCATGRLAEELSRHGIDVLGSYETIEAFVASAHNLLVPGGRLVIQVLNYDYFTRRSEWDLSPLESENVRLYRKNRFEDGILHFETVLEEKTTGRKHPSNLLLLPVLWRELRRILWKTKFREIDRFGGYDRLPFKVNSPLCIVNACRSMH